MKAGILFESAFEADSHLHYSFICETWCNYGNFQALPGNAKRALARYGYTAEKVNKFMPLVGKATEWTLREAPVEVLLDYELFTRWKELLNISNIICFG